MPKRKSKKKAAAKAKANDNKDNESVVAGACSTGASGGGASGGAVGGSSSSSTKAITKHEKDQLALTDKLVLNMKKKLGLMERPPKRFDFETFAHMVFNEAAAANYDGGVSPCEGCVKRNHQQNKNKAQRQSKAAKANNKKMKKLGSKTAAITKASSNNANANTTDAGAGAGTSGITGTAATSSGECRGGRSAHQCCQKSAMALCRNHQRDRSRSASVSSDDSLFEPIFGKDIHPTTKPATDATATETATETATAATTAKTSTVDVGCGPGPSSVEEDNKDPPQAQARRIVGSTSFFSSVRPRSTRTTSESSDDTDFIRVIRKDIVPPELREDLNKWRDSSTKKKSDDADQTKANNENDDDKEDDDQVEDDDGASAAKATGGIRKIGVVAAAAVALSCGGNRAGMESMNSSDTEYDDGDDDNESKRESKPVVTISVPGSSIKSCEKFMSPSTLMADGSVVPVVELMKPGFLKPCPRNCICCKAVSCAFLDNYAFWDCLNSVFEKAPARATKAIAAAATKCGNGKEKATNNSNDVTKKADGGSGDKNKKAIAAGGAGSSGGQEQKQDDISSSSSDEDSLSASEEDDEFSVTDYSDDDDTRHITNYDVKLRVAKKLFEKIKSESKETDELIKMIPNCILLSSRRTTYQKLQQIYKSLRTHQTEILHRTNALYKMYIRNIDAIFRLGFAPSLIEGRAIEISEGISDIHDSHDSWELLMEDVLWETKGKEAVVNTIIRSYTNQAEPEFLEGFTADEPDWFTSFIMERTMSCENSHAAQLFMDVDADDLTDQWIAVKAKINKDLLKLEECFRALCIEYGVTNPLPPVPAPPKEDDGSNKQYSFYKSSTSFIKHKL